MMQTVNSEASLTSPSCPPKSKEKLKKIEDAISSWAGGSLAPPPAEKAKKIESTVAMWLGEGEKKATRAKVTKKETTEKKFEKKNTTDNRKAGKHIEISVWIGGEKVKEDKLKPNKEDKSNEKLMIRKKQYKTNMTKTHSTPEIYPAGPEPPIEDPIPLRYENLKNLLDHLEKIKATESIGLFRESGHANNVRELVKKLGQVPPPVFADDNPLEGVNEFAGALKLYLREAPEPVIPFHELHKFLDVLDISDPLLRQYALSKAVNDLCQENHNMLRDLSLFLRRVVDNSDKNKMDLKNIAITLGPSVLRSPEFDFRITSRCCEILIILVTNCVEIFGQEPESLEDQLQVMSLGRRRVNPRKYNLKLPQKDPSSNEVYIPMIGEDTRRLLEDK